MKKITDDEFKGWSYMSNSASGKWLYYSPDNTESAMVEPSNGEVIFIMDLSSGKPIYTSPNVKKYAKGFGRRLPI
jgi:hypothetical protein